MSILRSINHNLIKIKNSDEYGTGIEYFREGADNKLISAEPTSEELSSKFEKAVDYDYENLKQKWRKYHARS
jgi:hypothetical protein